MKRSLLSLLAMLLPLLTWGNEWTDPNTKVIYEYNPGSLLANVKSGNSEEAGSPNVSGDIVILSSILVGGQTYSVSYIGDYAFAGLADLTGVTIPKGVDSIGTCAFNECTNLASATLPEGLIHIGHRAFRMCRSLTSIQIPESVTEIGSLAFSTCSKLASINIPKGLTELPDRLFNHCKSLTSIEIPSGIVIIGELTFHNCDGLTDIVIPEGVCSIGTNAFENCDTLTNVQIPSTVSRIGSNAFANCRNLSVVRSYIMNPFDVEAFNNVMNSTLQVPKNTKGFYSSTIGWDGFGVIEEMDWSGPDVDDQWTDPETEVVYSYYFSDKTAIVKDGSRAKGNITILSTINVNGKDYTVTGIGENSFNGCTDLTSIVISEGIKTIGYYAFNECSNMTSIIIPEGVTTIEYGAFRTCRALTSVRLPESLQEIGSMTFSTCSNLAHINIPSGLTQIPNRLFNHCKSLSDIGIPEGITSIGELAFHNCDRLTDIIIPEGVQSVGSEAFEDCDILSTISIASTVSSIGSNAFSSLKSLTTVTSFIQNPFAINAFDKTKNVTLYVPLGKWEKYATTDGWKDFGTIEEMGVVKPFRICVTDADSNDITEEVYISWYDTDGKLLGEGMSLGGLSDGTEVFVTVLLPESLGRIYREITRNKVTVEKGKTITCQLQRIEQLVIHAKVNAYGMPVTTAEVTLTQWLNKKYENAVSVKTDANGEFFLDAHNDSTELLVTANGYIDKKIIRRNLNNGGELGDIDMIELQGKVIALNLSYQEATREGEEPIVQNWYSDTRNIEYAIQNVTKGKEIDDYAIQQGNIVIPTGTDRGDKIQITIRSLNEKFAEATAEGIISDNDTAKVSINLLAFGGIEATYGQKGDNNLLTMLYDSTGKLQMRTVCSTSRLTFTNLAAGNYTLVTMGYNGAIGSVSNISDLANMELTEGTDYVCSSVTVRDGYITVVDVASVPELDASKFEYTGENTSYLPSKNNVVVGYFVTMNARIDFKEQFAQKVDNVRIIIDIPEGCELTPNSVVSSTKLIPYTYSGNKLTINLDKEDIDNRIRFCMSPTREGKYLTTAYVEFDYQGNKVQTMGQAVFEASSELYVPATTKTSSVSLSGMATPMAEVEIYDGDYLIGMTKAKANGKWSMDCELHGAYNLSTHEIYVKYQGQNGITGKTNSLECLYDINSIVVNSVTMINSDHIPGTKTARSIETVFDFIKQTTTPNNYRYWPSYPDFTFLIDLSENDTTKVSDVKLYVHTTDGDIRKLPAVYDGKLNRFVATGSFDMYSLPVNVSVDYQMKNIVAVISASYVADAYSAFESTITDIANKEHQIDDIRNEILVLESDADGDESRLIKLYSEYFSLIGIDPSNMFDEDVDDLTDEEIEKLKTDLDAFKSEYGTANAEGLLAQIYSEQKAVFDNEGIKGTFMTSTCDAYDEQNLDSDWQVISIDDGSKLYVLNKESEFLILDFKKNICFTFQFDNSGGQSRKRASGDAIDELNKRITQIGDILHNIQKNASKVFGVVEEVIAHIEAGEQFAQEGYGSAWRQLRKLKKAKAAGEAIADNRIFLLELTCEGYEAEIKGLKSLKRGVSHLNSKFYGVIFGAVGIVQKCIDCQNDLTEFINLYYSVPDSCKEDQARANSIRNTIRNAGVAAALYYIADLSTDVSSLLGVGPAVAAAPATAGTSLGVALVAIGKLALSVGIQIVYSRSTESFKNSVRSDIRSLKCKKDDNDNDDNDRPGRKKRKSCDDASPIHDPSGYVYEAVPTNRLQDVTASVYYDDEGAQFWNAEEFGEINPQITDETGLYAWDVPRGNWKVVFEKEGYETTETDWLPVPPPQLEVNIPMSQAVAPYVESAMGVESGITLVFSKYMKPNTLTKSKHVTVTVNGNNASGDVELLNTEENPFNKEEYASKIKFVPNTSFKSSDEVIITVKKEVESYAGQEMVEDFVQRVNIESEITEIACDSVMAVGYQGTGVLEVSVLPAAAAKGKTVQVASTSTMIASTNAQSATLNDDGKARIIVSGELPGNASLHLSMPEAGKEKYVAVYVVMEKDEAVKSPKASKLTGSEFETNYLLSLTCATKGATIYYTIDGSCPCDEQTRKKYTGPITLPEGQVTLQAIAVREGMTDSDIATFNYTVTKDASGVKVIEESHDFEANCQDGSIVITGAKGASCHIYDLQGRKLAIRSHIGNEAIINVPKTDVYVISVTFANEQTVVHKIMAK